ncbi:MAG: glycosyltransferase family 39 protein, partial [Chloroflexi bacterium]|nr:glycosyltransferase family 39 protein [Chloroflexota bacterium]
MQISPPWRTTLALALVLAAAAALRLVGLDWDGGSLFHPDERAILLKVGELALPWPPNWTQLLDPATSPLNPRWFAYGSFPLYLLKAVSAAVAQVQPSLGVYPDLRFVGRVITVAFDLGTVLLTFLVAARLYRPTVGLLAAAFVAFSVLHIQLSHFYTVDVLLACLTMLTLYGAALTLRGLSWGASALMGIGLGLGLATKVSIAPLALAVVAVHLLPHVGRAAGAVSTAAPDGPLPLPQKPPPLTLSAAHLALTFGLAGALFFIAEPFALLDSVTFLRDVREQNEMVLRVRDYPYTRQYQQLVVWGLGVPLGLVCIVGALAAVRRAVMGRHPADLLLLAWIVPYFAITGAFPVKFMRYLLPIVPVFAIFAARLLLDWRARGVATAGTGPLPQPFPHFWGQGAGRGTTTLLAQKPPCLACGVPLGQGAGRGTTTLLAPSSVLHPLPPELGERGRGIGGRLLPAAVITLTLAATVWYAIAYLNVYRGPHPAVVASAWLRSNLLPGAVILQEHWEEGLPRLEGFTRKELRPYEPDDIAKLQHLSTELAGADAVVFYSNRLYGTIPRLPDRYPITTRYYRLLFSGDLGYELAYVASASPSFLGVTLADDTFGRPGLPSPGPAATPRPTAITLNLGYADESFTVYDHPKVMVFRKVRRLTAEQITVLLGAPTGIEVPSAAAGSGTGLLLSASDRAAQQAGGTWRT